MLRGEVWMVFLPAAPAGREQAGQRPAIIIQDPGYGQASPLVLVVPLTSQSGAARFPATVTILPTAANGLSAPSIAMVFQTRALDRARFIRRLGALSDADLAAVLLKLNRLTGQQP
jgi:mRNA interferase MazF